MIFQCPKKAATVLKNYRNICFDNNVFKIPRRRKRDLKSKYAFFETSARSPQLAYLDPVYMEWGTTV